MKDADHPIAMGLSVIVIRAEKQFHQRKNDATYTWRFFSMKVTFL